MDWLSFEHEAYWPAMFSYTSSSIAPQGFGTIMFQKFQLVEQPIVVCLLTMGLWTSMHSVRVLVDVGRTKTKDVASEAC